MAYGITSEGFVKKDLQTIKTELETEYKNSFGDDLDVSESSPEGQLIGNTAVKLANLWELLQEIYNSFNPDKATGISLDESAALVGIERLSSTNSEVILSLYGDQGTIVPINHLVKQTETNEEFEQFEATTIDLAECSDITFSVNTVSDSTLYTITINGTDFDYTSDSDATALEIVAGLIAAIDAGSEPVLTTDNLDETGRIYSDDGKTAFSIVLDSKLDTDEQGTPSRYLAVNTGPISVPSNTITEIVNPISGLDRVNNLAAGITGRDLETDSVFRRRRRETVSGIGNATDESIRFRILQEVANVTSVNVTSNRTLITDGEGRPAKSFEAVVVGGDDQEIGDKIWEVQPSGIESHGNTSVTVIDSTEREQTVEFSRPVNVYIWVEVDFEKYEEETFPQNGTSLIKENIVSWSLNEFVSGKDVINKRLNIPIYEINGVGDTTIRLGKSATPGGPPGPVTEDDIAITNSEIAVFSVDRITVTEV